MADGRGDAPHPACSAALPISERVTGPEALYVSARKCWKGVGRKYSSQAYMLDIVAKTVTLSRELRTGKYREGKTRTVRITYPKPRTALAITFRDRVFQRSLNDNALYPQMTRGFIRSNFACQKGRGTDAALAYFRKALRKAYLSYGRTNRFRILSCDIKGYYDNMEHSVTDRRIREKCDPWTAAKVTETLARQYKGTTGYNPGSQMVQIAGISYLDRFDHFMKESLRRRHYLRYMDDMQVLGGPDEDMESLRSAMDAELGKTGLRLHPGKTRTVSASDGVVFLGFLFRVTATGKVLMFRDPKRVKEIKRRLRRLANKIARGEAPAEAFGESYRCVRSCMEKGSSARLLRRMDDFVEQLRQEVENAEKTHAA